MTNQVFSPDLASQLINVFILYHHDSQDDFNKIKGFLKPAEETLGIRLWDYTHIKAGMLWEEEKQKTFSSADLILLLINDKFLIDSSLMNLVDEAMKRNVVQKVFLLTECNYGFTSIKGLHRLNPDETFDAIKALNQNRQLKTLTYQLGEIAQDIRDRNEVDRREKERLDRLRTAEPPKQTTRQESEQETRNIVRRESNQQSGVFNSTFIIGIGIVIVIAIVFALAFSVGGGIRQPAIVPTITNPSTTTTLPPGSSASATEKLEDPKGVVSVEWLSDAKSVIYASGDGKTSMVSTTVGSPKVITEAKGQTNGINVLAVSPDKKVFAIGGSDGLVKIFQEDGKVITTTSSIGGGVHSLAWSPNNTLAVGSKDGNIYLLKADGSPLSTIMTQHNGSVVSLAWSPDGSKLASGSLDSSLKIWQSPNYDAAIQTIEFPPSGGGGLDYRVSDIVWSTKTSTLAASSWNGNVVLWNKVGDRTFLKLENYGKANKVAWSPDGTKLAVAYEKKVIGLWEIDAQQLKILKEFPPLADKHTKDVYAIAWSPNGKILTSGSWDSNICFWSATGDYLKTLTGHTNRIYTLKWTTSNNENILVSGSEDNKVLFWDENGIVKGDRATAN